MIQVSNLTKTYSARRRTVTAVDRIRFACRAGSIVGLLGPNGAGKTTTLRIIATILEPTSGEVRVDGLNTVSDADRVRTRIGFHTGETGLYSRLTSRETLRHFGRVYGMAASAVARRTEQLASDFGLGDFMDKRVGTLSTGMKQRVSLARAVVHDPPILLLDEPMTGLDMVARRGVMEFMRRMREAGKCILFSTHALPDAEALCDELVLMYAGKVVGAGSIAGLRLAHGNASIEDIIFDQVESSDAAVQA